jgi:hypothetical protein
MSGRNQRRAKEMIAKTAWNAMGKRFVRCQQRVFVVGVVGEGFLPKRSDAESE